MIALVALSCVGLYGISEISAGVTSSQSNMRAIAVKTEVLSDEALSMVSIASRISQSQIPALYQSCNSFAQSHTLSTQALKLKEQVLNYANATQTVMDTLVTLESPMKGFKTHLSWSQLIPLLVILVVLLAGCVGLCCTDFVALKTFKVFAVYFVLVVGLIGSWFLTWSLTVSHFCMNPDTNELTALHSSSQSSAAFENVTAYYSTCSGSSILDANLDLISTASRELRFVIYDGASECSTSDITSLTSSLTWTQLQAEAAREKVSCGRFHYYWEDLMHSDVCGAMIVGSLMLNLAAVLSLPLFVISVSVIHNHTRALKSWRVRPSAFRWRYRGLREDEPLSPHEVSHYETHTHTHHTRKTKATSSPNTVMSPDPREPTSQLLDDVPEERLADGHTIDVSSNDHNAKSQDPFVAP
eukprot:c10452_g1_i1.p1 GENE.c10452_g1_i1~~c10452_g1_i1.p1  ORF type:complete len:414 (-),score=105.16 c10452_g1_i1:593-1834(-)